MQLNWGGDYIGLNKQWESCRLLRTYQIIVEDAVEMPAGHVKFYVHVQAIHVYVGEV
jgi:hypothetical protein